MRRLVLLLALPLAACLGVTDPFPRPANAVDVNIDFCINDLPTWFVVKNEGQGWRVITRQPRQRFTIPVTPKVMVAYGRTALSPTVFSQAKVMFVTAEELESATCGALIGQKTLYVNVTGHDLNESVFASIAGGAGRTDPCTPSCVFGTRTQVRMTGVGEGPVDMLAYRFSRPSNRMEYILRHNINAPHQSLLDSIDFNSSEAGFAVRLPLEVTGGLNATVFSRFISSGGTTLDIGASNVAGGFGDYFALLPHMLATGDLHRVSVITPEGMSVVTYASPAEAVRVDPGPALRTPAITTVQEDSVLRLRATLPAQAEYPRYVAATFSQATDGIPDRVISVIMTRAYLDGLPGEWELEIPPMPFLNSAAQLKPGVVTNWRVEAWSDVPPRLFFGDKGATAGAVVRCATTSSSQSAATNVCRSPLLIR